MTDKKLYRSRTSKMLCGVCGGIGEYFNIDPTLIRLLFVLFGCTGGGDTGIYHSSDHHTGSADVNLDSPGNLGVSKADENTEAIYQRRIQSGCAGGFGSELRGSENYEIRDYAKNRNQQGTTRLRLRHPHTRSERFSQRCSAVFGRFSASRPHTQIQISVVFYSYGPPHFSDVVISWSTRFCLILRSKLSSDSA